MSPKKSRKLLSKLLVRTWDPEVVYYRVLSTFVVDNCLSYDWSKRILGLIRARDFVRLYEWADSSAAVACGTAHHVYCVNQLSALVLKYTPPAARSLGFMPEERAREKYSASEERCRKSNIRLRKLRVSALRTRFRAKLTWMREWIESVIGFEPDLPAIYSGCDFSTGASIGVHGDRTNLFRKIEAPWTCTPSAMPYVLSAVKCNPQLSLALLGQEIGSGAVCLDPLEIDAIVQRKLVRCDYNKISFVPKTARVSRPIAVEPIGNSFIQKGIEKSLKNKLRSVGIDLSDQSRNSELARIGSTDGSLFTLDLSSASDCVSIELVRLLFPEAWWNLFDSTRSPSYLVDGKIHRYHKIASMGNGFCFPLETLIFSAALRACLVAGSGTVPREVRRHIAVYGDDIIGPVEVYDDVVELLAFLGFIPNKDKSYNAGGFRESCGADWYNGLDVRPVYLDYHLTDLSDIMVFHNCTLRSPIVSDAFTGVREYLRSLVPSPLMRPLSPISRRIASLPLSEAKDASGAFHVERDEFMTCKWARWNRSEQRWSWLEIHVRPVLDDSSSGLFRRCQYLAFLNGGKLAVRRKVRRILTMI